MTRSRIVVVYKDPMDGEECEAAFDGDSREAAWTRAERFITAAKQLVRVEYWELQDVGEPPKFPPITWRGKP